MENIEQIAREYRAALENSAQCGGSEIEQIIILEENQIDLISGILPRLSPSQRRTANYLKNVTYRVLSKLSALQGAANYVPSFRNINTAFQAPINAIMSTQINIFVLYDRLSTQYAEIAEILSLENRKLGLIALL